MFKRIISSALIATQLGFVGIATANTTLSRQTAEFNLLRTSIALAGQGLSQDELSTRTAEAFDAYNKTADQNGRVERMEQAMVSLGLYTPERAQELTTEAQTFASTINTPDVQTANEAASRELMMLASKYPMGAQFSGCDLGVTLDIVGAVTGVAGGIVWNIGNANNETEVITGITMTSAGVLAIIDGIIIYHYAQGC